ncbi:MAG: DUF4111 domain-containing protein [Candidatus Zixiibacteriota bacterium]|nr:MAG: DUF4111 domain-containing protein [candidate division Zixibacteria bacterium]
MNTSQQIETACGAFLDGLKEILGEKLYGVYIYGAAAFPGTFPLIDIDFHVILKSDLTEDERSRLERLHEELDRDYPPPGEIFDGYYILLEAARKKSYPGSQMWENAVDDSWALHRAHILAGRHITLYGPDPKEIYPPPTWPEIEDPLYGELDYIEKNLQKYPAYCVLNLCRLIYSFETGDVVISKEQASDWALKNLQGWEKYIETAVKLYCRQATTEDEKSVLSEIGKFLEYAKERIDRSSRKNNGYRSRES